MLALAWGKVGRNVCGNLQLGLNLSSDSPGQPPAQHKGCDPWLGSLPACQNLSPCHLAGDTPGSAVALCQALLAPALLPVRSCRLGTDRSGLQANLCQQELCRSVPRWGQPEDEG